MPLVRIVRSTENGRAKITRVNGFGWGVPEGRLKVSWKGPLVPTLVIEVKGVFKLRATPCFIK